VRSPKECVLDAYDFRPPERIPRFDSFWDFPNAWREELGDPSLLSDVVIWCPNEGAFPRRARTLEKRGDHKIAVDSWGATKRTRRDSYFYEVLDVAIPPGTDPDRVSFDPPDLDSRFGKSRDAAEETRCVFGKTGGPYLRTTFVRGETQFLLDIAEDPVLARALADKMADHLTRIGLEELQRWNLYDTGMSIWDDMAFNHNPLFSPEQFERIFLPGYRRMIRTWKEAGARRVFFHSDGNVLSLLDMLLDAGIDGLNPLERRAGMDPFLLREKYPQLVLIGGMDNTNTLIYGPVDRIKKQTRELLNLGRNGGLIIGTHSISPEIPLEHYRAYLETSNDLSAIPKTRQETYH